MIMSKSLLERTRLNLGCLRWLKMVKLAMLKLTKIECKLITDPDIFIFFKKGTGCGISYISNKYSKY